MDTGICIYCSPSHCTNLRLTELQAVVDNNLVLVRLLHIHGADLNKTDSDSWTPLHAAAANGHHTIVSYLLAHGAERNKRTEEGETALDLVEEDDLTTLAVLQDTKDEVEVARRLSVAHDVRQEKEEPAWVRRMSLQEAARKESVKEVEVELDTRRKGSAWVGKEEIPEEEEADEEEEEGEIKTQSTDVKHEEEIKRDIKTVRLKAPAPAVPAVVRQRRTGRLEVQLSQQTNNVTQQFLSTPSTSNTSSSSSSTSTSSSSSPPLDDNKSGGNKTVLTDTKSQKSHNGQTNTKTKERVTESKMKDIIPKEGLIEADKTLKFSAGRPAAVRLESKDR